MNILDFFVPNEQTKEIIVSERFCDKEGKPIPFVIRAVKEEDSRVLRRISTEDGKVNADKYLMGLVIKAVQSPDLKNSELQQAYSVLGEERLISKMLLAGEYAKLCKAVQKISGFDTSIDERIEESKN